MSTPLATVTSGEYRLIHEGPFGSWGQNYAVKRTQATPYGMATSEIGVGFVALSREHAIATFLEYVGHDEDYDLVDGEYVECGMGDLEEIAEEIAPTMGLRYPRRWGERVPADHEYTF